MRTAIFILVGLLLMAAFFAGAKYIAADNTLRVATTIFILIWFAVAAGNMWMGVARAGYSVREEFPIFLIIFAVPVIAAILLAGKLS